jgi:hypothetical protein
VNLAQRSPPSTQRIVDYCIVRSGAASTPIGTYLVSAHRPAKSEKRRTLFDQLVEFLAFALNGHAFDAAAVILNDLEFTIQNTILSW